MVLEKRNGQIDFVGVQVDKSQVESNTVQVDLILNIDLHEQDVLQTYRISSFAQKFIILRHVEQKDFFESICGRSRPCLLKKRI